MDTLINNEIYLCSFFEKSFIDRRFCGLQGCSIRIFLLSINDFVQYDPKKGNGRKWESASGIKI